MRDLFNEPPSRRTAASPTAYHHECARRLRAGIHTARHRLTRWSARAWAAEFRRLEESIIPPGAPAQARLTAALEWYVRHMGEPYVPHAYSARGFRAKYDQIEAAMRRDASDNPTLTITPAAREIADRLADRGWPRGAETQLPAVVQMSLDFLEPWCAALWRLRRSPHARTARIAAAIAAGDLGAPAHYVENWFRDVHRRVKNWDGWSGRLSDFAVRADAKRFVQDGRDAAERATGDAGAWDALQRAVAVDCKTMG